MSSNLYWKPITVTSSRALSVELKLALKKRYGSLNNMCLEEVDVDYLSGIRDSGIDDADILIEAIRQYGNIELKEIY